MFSGLNAVRARRNGPSRPINPQGSTYGLGTFDQATVANLVMVGSSGVSSSVEEIVIGINEAGTSMTSRREISSAPSALTSAGGGEGANSRAWRSPVSEKSVRKRVAIPDRAHAFNRKAQVCGRR